MIINNIQGLLFIKKFLLKKFSLGDIIFFPLKVFPDKFKFSSSIALILSFHKFFFSEIML